MKTPADIRDIFYSGTHAFNGDPQIIAEIAFLLDKNYISLNSVVVAPKSDYLDILREIAANPGGHDSASGGGYAHMALKVVTARHIKNVYGKDTRFEQPFCGYYPDVLSTDKLTVAECGHTQNPAKILDYFRQGNIRLFMQIPYPTEDVESVSGYAFTAERELIEFLDLLDDQKRTSIKAILAKKKDGPA